MQTLQEVSVGDFKKFVIATSYVTDAEKFGWSIVQRDVFNFNVSHTANYLCPDGIVPSQDYNPVTQVSYNDAKAYADWTKTSIPSYQQYWKLVKQNQTNININSTFILPIGQSNIIGNVWDITLSDQINRIRLAGGSYLCNFTSCNGTSKKRELYVDKITGNSHLSFVVLKP